MKLLLGNYAIMKTNKAPRRINYIIVTLCFFIMSCATKGTMQQRGAIDDIRIAFLREDYPSVIKQVELLPKCNINKKDYYRAYYYLALSYLKQGEFDTARYFLRRLKAKGSRVEFIDEVNIKLAESYFLEGKYKRALELYKSFVEQYPKSQFLPVVYFRVGKIYQKLGKFTEAKAKFAEIRRLFPLSFEAEQLDKTNIDEISFFSVQVGAFYDRDNAENLKTELEEKDYDVSILKTEKNGTNYFRVRVGSFTTSDEVQKYEKKLKEEGYRTIIYP